MRRLFFSSLGILLVLASVAGIIISISGIFGLWHIEKNTERALLNTFDLLDTTLQATHDGLSIASDTLTQANDSLDSVVEGLDSTGNAVLDLVPLVDSLKTLTSEDLPAALATTKTAFDSAQASAQVIDNTLGILTAIPFLGTQRYNNSVPLGTAFGGVSESLDPISTSLSSMEESLEDSKDNLGDINTSFADISLSLSGIDTNLSEAQGVTDQYLGVVEELDGQLETAREKMPRTLKSISWFLTIALVWLALTQLGLLMQALEMLGLRFPLEQRAEADIVVENAIIVDEMLEGE